MQTLLFPDPRPLVDQLGPEFFRNAPSCPGVYLMRDAVDTVLYVGKARDLRKRLASYRVANPQRLPRRHLRLLRAVARIELQECPDESAAIAREAELLLALKPKFNRAGTWRGPDRWIGWRVIPEGLELAVADKPESGWHSHGPIGAGAFPLHAAIARLLWAAIHPDRGLSDLPAGWFAWRHHSTTLVTRHQAPSELFTAAETRLTELFSGRADEFITWIHARFPAQIHPFHTLLLETDLETITHFAARG